MLYEISIIIRNTESIKYDVISCCPHLTQGHPHEIMKSYLTHLEGVITERVTYASVFLGVLGCLRFHKIMCWMHETIEKQAEKALSNIKAWAFKGIKYPYLSPHCIHCPLLECEVNVKRPSLFTAQLILRSHALKA